MVFISVWPVLKSFPQIARLFSSASVLRAGISTVRLGAPLAKGNTRLQGRIGINHRGRDRLVVLTHRLFKRFERLVNGMLLEKDLSGGCPNHYHSRAAILTLPFRDLVDELLEPA